MQVSDSARAAAAAALVVLCTTFCSRSTPRAPEPEPEPHSDLRLKPEPEPEPTTETPVSSLAPIYIESDPGSGTSSVEPEPAAAPLQLSSDPAPELEPGRVQSPKQINVHQPPVRMYLPVPAGAPRSERSPPTTQNQSGGTAAARRLRASRAGRISTANYRPLPPTGPSTTASVQHSTCFAAFQSCGTNGSGQSQPHRVRFGDILGLHCHDGQLATLDPTKKVQPAATTTWARPQWEIVMRSRAVNGDGNGAEGGEFEVHPSWEWSKQRAFSGAARQVSVGQAFSVLL
eukprot:COSAG02_NODE_159_length_32891_cov_17.822518_9_plen_288_part_00